MQRRRRRLALGLAFGAALAAASCGARTGLLEETSDASGSGVPDAGADIVDVLFPPPDLGAPETLPDVVPMGCTSDSECDDGIDCTIDRCDLASQTCTHDPDDGRCTPGFRCEPPVGCVATSFAVSSELLYGVELPGGSVASLGVTAGTFQDIALRADGTLYAVTKTELLRVDIKSGNASLIAMLPENLNALDFGPDGTLYASGSSSSGVFTVDPDDGKLTRVGSLPHGYTSSGDLAVIGGTLFLTSTNLEDPEDMEDTLLGIDLATFAVSVVGKLGYWCVYGLASYGARLFGFTCEGQVIEIDAKTAVSKFLAHAGPRFYGASAR
jgi:hypothetical protein